MEGREAAWLQTIHILVHMTISRCEGAWVLCRMVNVEGAKIARGAEAAIGQGCGAASACAARRHGCAKLYPKIMMATHPCFLSARPLPSPFAFPPFQSFFQGQGPLWEKLLPHSHPLPCVGGRAPLPVLNLPPLPCAGGQLPEPPAQRQIWPHVPAPPQPSLQPHQQPGALLQ